MKDVFICHASEDKETVVRPLVTALETAGITCWLDEADIHWGESITQQVNDGLSRAQFVIVVLSKALLPKHWPQRELNAALNLEASSGQVKVLPLLYGDEQTVKEIFSALPLLNDKVYLPWNGEPSSIVSVMLVRLGRPAVMSDTVNLPYQPKFNVPLPKIKKGFTDFDRTKFLKEGFLTIREYFQDALTQLSSHYPNIQYEIEDVTSQKFISQIFRDGTLLNTCNIRIGGLGSSDFIGYSEGRFNLQNDNSYNEMISVEDDGNDLLLAFSFGSFYGNTQNRLHTPTEAAETLWKRFTSQLGF